MVFAPIGRSCGANQQRTPVICVLQLGVQTMGKWIVL
jgi:hypothetical protein